MDMSPYREIGKAHGLPICYVPMTGSTNADAKRLAAAGAPEALLIAGEQSAGRGRLGRQFYSPGGGIYMTFLLRPVLPPEEVTRLTTLAAVAVAEAITEVSGRAAGIKWVNDVYIGGKKAVGILSEGGFGADGHLQYAVTGIGVNTFAPPGGFPPPLDTVATAVWPHEARAEALKEALIDRITEKFMTYYRAWDTQALHERYRALSFLPGRRVTVLKGESRAPALALDIDGDNHLLVRYEDGREEALATGEVSIRMEPTGSNDIS